MRGVSIENVKAILFALSIFVAVPSLRADELERFWRDFPGFKNTLSTYSYDRSFSSDAKPEFVDAVIRDAAKKPSRQRMNEYACVLYYMDRKIVSERLAALELSSSAAIRNAVAAVQKRLKAYDDEAKQKHPN
jgi:hypothetical protein